VIQNQLALAKFTFEVDPVFYGSLYSYPKSIGIGKTDI
jgi:hypothetical protein